MVGLAGGGWCQNKGGDDGDVDEAAAPAEGGTKCAGEKEPGAGDGTGLYSGARGRAGGDAEEQAEGEAGGVQKGSRSVPRSYRTAREGRGASSAGLVVVEDHNGAKCAAKTSIIVR